MHMLTHLSTIVLVNLELGSQYAHSPSMVLKKFMKVGIFGSSICRVVTLMLEELLMILRCQVQQMLLLLHSC